MEIPKDVVFNGVKYSLVSRGRYYLSQSNSNAGRKNPKGLHVAVWEYFSGKKVPAGYEVHHKDGNTFNNDFSNLECLPIREHRKTANLKTEKVRKHLDEIRHLASAWHKSEEGREWHRNHARKEKTPKECTCINCGAKFLSKRVDAKYCSRKCEVSYRYHHEAKEVERICAFCGKPFKTLVGPYRHSSNVCSISCRTKWGRLRKGSGVQSND